MYITEN